MKLYEGEILYPANVKDHDGFMVLSIRGDEVILSDKCDGSGETRTFSFNGLVTNKNVDWVRTYQVRRELILEKL